VLITFGLYLITIFELNYVITDYKITFFSRPEGMSLFRWKQKGFMYFIPCAILISFFYNNKRSKFVKFTKKKIKNLFLLQHLTSLGRKKSDGFGDRFFELG
jgi:hypothetical protein